MPPYEILVLEDDEHALSGMLEMLRDAGHHATGVTTYDAAGRLLEAQPYELLITDVRLGAFNGLHLVKRTRIEQREMAVIIVTGYPQPLLEAEARRYDAVYMVKPIKPDNFLATVSRCLSRVRRRRRWPRRPVPGGLAASVANREAKILEVSYGGLRFAMPAPPGPLPASFQVRLPTFGLAVDAEAIWTDRDAPGGTLMCGAELSQPPPETARAWRGFVDALSAGA